MRMYIRALRSRIFFMERCDGWCSERWYPYPGRRAVRCSLRCAERAERVVQHSTAQHSTAQQSRPARGRVGALYFTILSFAILSFIILSFTILSFTILSSTILSSTIPSSTILSFTPPSYTISIVADRRLAHQDRDFFPSSLASLQYTGC